MTTRRCAYLTMENTDGWMELELIEPSMYLRMDTGAPRRFAEAFDEYVTKMSGSL